LTFSPSSTSRRLFKMSRRLAIADTVRFNFRAIEGLSIFEGEKRQKLRVLRGRPWSASWARA